ncbi:hypothetical protein A3F28_00435 [Candidatus Uhrbacteria bacterium RIFCSPHIGHO2_12_FULL_57_11]|uniref:Type II secretion system protein GspG C-terminal domain-containing protein n=2 Tax=Candidatus Uhriibacteriota TaxID=1752732 RepID=A0A1F7UGW7_9BACT|nr:MAG: hypothetical protein A3D72_03135 [Candidatus Uhrbacteria bacterium RIFCSPHIGHO2_02_FULL_57_19]OGL77509.1 MAG: hypothetical protein A3F28_00435 [Candidatus Uhrbacteria bacterium RIFCSPHIGHO2_12_FULL_57_11]
MKGVDFRNRKGFTLIELLIIIGIIAILFAVILIAVDPVRRFAEARNAVRREDVRDILEAILEYTTDFKGNYPSGIDNSPGSVQVLGTYTSGCDSTCTATSPAETSCLDISPSLVETYLSEIPPDPAYGSAGNTDYYVDKTTGGRIIVGACDPERGETIKVAR